MRTFLDRLRSWFSASPAPAKATDGIPFRTLDVPPPAYCSRAFYEKWVDPFYLTDIISHRDRFSEALRPVYDEVDDDLVRTLLTDRNWRSRTTGALFAAIASMHELEELIGRLFLRSDVPFAGDTYCLALARFDTPHSLACLSDYLDYYLTRPDLEFDQNDALAALIYLDRRHGTAHHEPFLPRYAAFAEGKPKAWNVDLVAEWFDRRMASVEAIAAAMPG